MADLITLDELRAARGTDPTDHADDDQWTWMISAASAIVANYAQRDFGAPNITETRTYDYDGCGMLDIDDANIVTALELVIPNGTNLVLDPSYQWAAMPSRRDDSPVYWYITLNAVRGNLYGSPEMGFTRNLDRLVAEYGVPSIPTRINVTATWGWPVVPDDVKQAVVWTLDDWIARPKGEQLTSEAIAGYSRAWGRGTGQTVAALALPDRARDVLASYQKLNI